MKKILGLDLGTNSIGWALVGTDEKGNPNKIINAGARIIPMDATTIGDFEKGNTKSQTAKRTGYRGMRRLRERSLLRRERLHRVLKIMGFLPKHYEDSIGWDKSNNRTYGKFLNESEPKIPWKLNNEGKYEFIFKSSFEEMMKDFSLNQPKLIQNNKKVPYDWTIYYLRKKALSSKITKEELSWIILNFNQKRGYYQLRGEDEDTSDKREYVERLKVVKIEKGGTDNKNDKKTWYSIVLENGWVYSATFTNEPDWLNKIKEFLITEEIDENGNVKVEKDKKNGTIGKEKRKITILPSFEEIEALDEANKNKIYKKIKAKTELTINESGKTVGTYIYDALLQNPYQKLRGKLIRTIERKFYKEELRAILEKQKEYHSELNDRELYELCINELYEQNDSHRNNILCRNFIYLFLDDIIFYHRPLKSKKSLISDCPFEVREYQIEDDEGKKQKIKKSLKCIAKSNPIYQEFRLWKFVANLRIYQKEKDINGKLQIDVDVTNEFLKNEEDYVSLFEWLNDRKEIEQNVLLNSYYNIKKPKGKESQYPYRWNYVEDKTYPCNETRSMILSGLKKSNINIELTQNMEMSIWHILYSVEDKQEIEKALRTFAKKNGFTEDFVENFKSCKPFKKEYGAFSEKAIKKLLPLMRMGKYWSEDSICKDTKDRIEKIITGEYDENLKTRVRERSINLTEINHFRALPEWLASYIVYDRFSEAKEVLKWETPEELDEYILKFKQHSLRNPIVEQVVLETLRVVRDIWIKEGKFEEIHVELGREMKNDKKERERLSKIVSENENTNSRIRQILMEFSSPEYNIENVRPYSPYQQEILKIYEEFAIANLSKEDSDYDFITKVSKSSLPSKNEIIRYKLWLEQKYRSPYTGEMIPLSKLFTTSYQIEHIIPQKRFFDDSFSNKVICESEVNSFKDDMLGYEFIKKCHGQKIQTANKTVTIFSVEEYENFVKKHYSNLKSKMKKLLMDDIPDSFTQRQLNDTRYISKEVKRLLSNIVREKLNNGEYEQEATSKNLISITGAITSKLRQDWGLNDKWNELILPRFERLDTKTNTNGFTTINKEGHKIPDVPLELKKGFSTKRIDHRHHAMDAITIACATRNQVNYLNNESAKEINKRNDLKKILCEKTKTDEAGNYKWVFRKPWENFSEDVKDVLDNIIISYKQNLRVINKNTNLFQKYNEKGKKVFHKQEKGDNWAIRKSMHKATVYGEVNLRKEKEVKFDEALKNPKSIVEKDLKNKIIELQGLNFDDKRIKKYFDDNKDTWEDINFKKIKTYYFTKDILDPLTNKPKERYFATRKTLDISFDVNKIINSVTDTGIQKILLTHLELNENNPKVAFSPEGIEKMNKNLKELNNGKEHKPIYKVRVYEKADKFAIGNRGNKKDKFVEAADSTNLFFAVYQKKYYNEETYQIEYLRDFKTIALKDVINRQKEYLQSVPETNNGDELLFVLSPYDLVYVPTEYEINKGINYDKINLERIYIVNDFNKKIIYFTPNRLAKAIDKKEIDTSYDTKTASLNGVQIKSICVPIMVDRLGNIIK